MDIGLKSNKRKPLFSTTSEDSSENDYELQTGLFPYSNMNKRQRKKKMTTSRARAVPKQSTSRRPLRSSVDIPKSAVNTSNTYAVLSDNDDDNVADNSASKKPKPVKIPPIVCIDAKYIDMMNLMKQANVVNFSMKYISMGIKIFCTSLDDFDIARKTLTINKVQHFTHDVASNKNQKFVLSGLPNFEPDEVKAALKEQNVDVFDVKKMKTKYESENYALFLVYFVNGSTTLQYLRRVKYILNVAVGWKSYQQSRNGPTQCNNCQLYGHGNKNCSLQPRCAKCGQKHQTSACLKDQLPQPETSFVPKCCLCGGDHSSKDRNCPKRQVYINMKLNQSKSSKSSNGQNRQFSSTQPPKSVETPVQPSVPVNQNKKYSDWFKPTHPNESGNQSRNDLLSNDLLMTMMTELFQGLRASRTRLDQIQTVTTVVLKYVSIDNYD